MSFYDPIDDEYLFEARKVAKEQPSLHMWGGKPLMDDPPVIADDVIASLSMDADGQVRMRANTFTGAKERAGERLLAEAARSGMTPYSAILSKTGGKSLVRSKQRIDADPEGYLNKLKKMQKTGKLNKLWSALPFVGAAATAYSVLSAPSVEAATEAAVSELDPFGIALPEKVNVGDDKPHGGLDQNSARNKYLEFLKEYGDK